MLFVYSWNLCHLKNRGVNLHWFHSPIQLRLSLSTQYHDASHSQFSILLYMATFSYKFISNWFCAKFTFFFYYYISRLLFKTITYKCSLSIQRFADNSYCFLIVLEFRIFVKLKIKIRIRILGVHQAAWHTKCDDEVLSHFNAFFFLSLSSWTHSMGAAHSKYSVKREHQCGEDVVYLKTENKPFTQNAFLLHFLEGYLSSGVAHKRAQSHVNLIVSSTLKQW